MSHRRFDCAVIGGGIVGLATAHEILERRPGTRLVLLEKEPAVAAHQTGHNSGVIHSGVYYRPGSLKAKLCLEGRERLIRFCQRHAIPYRIDGKVIVARDASELAPLEAIWERARGNGIADVRRIDGAEIAEHEPHIRGVAALWVPSAGVVDYRAVAQALASAIQAAGGTLLLGHAVAEVRRERDVLLLRTPQGDVEADRVVACGGLQCDRLAGDSEETRGIRIVPFRGDYYRLRPEAEGWIRALVYPVPDARFPFLGVHFARHINGEVTAGPNAVLSLSREGYGRYHFDPADAWSTLTWPGFWRLAGRHWRKGAVEVWRDYVKAAYARELRHLLPELGPQDLLPGPCGIRAQAVFRDGALADDFLIAERERAVHVLNAPSPAATSAFAIGREIVDRLPA